jgi:energy-coupling factor transport system ATP-binding protein
MNLTLDDVTITRGQWHLAARGTFDPGIHLVSGDVGSGKSTLALAMAGLFPAGPGQIVPDGIGSTMISFQFPEYHITGLTAREESVSWGLDPGHLLSATGLDPVADIDPLRLSRGELKRLHLACVLSREYDLLILDEPFSSLDLIEKRRICQRISGRTKGITIIFTHEQAVFPRVDHIWQIESGTLHHCGQPPDCLSLWRHAPAVIRGLVAQGRVPVNISPDDLEAAACRT